MTHRRSTPGVLALFVGYYALALEPLPARGQPANAEAPAQSAERDTTKAGEAAAGETEASPAPATAPDARSSIEERLRQMVARPGGLTAEQAAARAMQVSYRVRAAEQDIRSADADVDRVIADGAPRLDLIARYTRLSEVDLPTFGPGSGSLVGTPAGEGPLPAGAPLVGIPASVFTFPQILNQYHLQAALKVPVSTYVLSIGHAYAAAKRSRRAAELTAQAERLAAGMAARAQYYNWVRAVLQGVVSEQALEQAQATLERTELARGAGRASEADVLNARAAVASSEFMLEQAKSRERLARQEIQLLLHDDGGAKYAIGEDVLMAPKETTPINDLPALYREAKRNRLEVKAVMETAESVAEGRKVVSARQAPRVEAFGNVYYSRPNPRFIPQQDKWDPSWDVGIQLTWSPSDFFTSGAEAAQLSAERRKADIQRAQLIDALRREVLQAATSLREARFGVGTAERGLEAAEKAYEVQSVLYEYGRSTSLELVQVRTQLLQARISLVNALINVRIAEATLHHALGRDVPKTGARR